MCYPSVSNLWICILETSFVHRLNALAASCTSYRIFFFKMVTEIGAYVHTKYIMHKSDHMIWKVSVVNEIEVP